MGFLRPLRQLYVQVIIAIIAGIALGHFYPQTGEALKPLSTVGSRCR